ncbi:MAG TPA: FlgD immunoglobulin-like domain containing protein [Thermoanaerobaculia bacterium]
MPRSLALVDGLCCVLLSLNIDAQNPSLRVEVSPSAFNPSAGQTSAIDCITAGNGQLEILVVDRDGFVVRHLVHLLEVSGGTYRAKWDGKDDDGRVVADEAYSFKVDFTSSGRTSTWFPAAKTTSAMTTVSANYYDRASGILSYTLATPSRVHIQAGTSRTTRAGKAEGPVLRTIVNREPRVAGAVIEQWDGKDESGTIYVPELPDFVVAIATTPLPEGSVIATGNRTRDFLSDAANRKGSSLTPHTGGLAAHHEGLFILDDTSPRMTLGFVRGKRGLFRSRNDRLNLVLNGPAATTFAKQPAHILVFADGKLLCTHDSPTQPVASIECEVPRSAQILAVDWVSTYGPVAAQALRLHPGRPDTKSPSARRSR